MKINEEKRLAESLLLYDLTDEKIDDNLDFIEQEFLQLDLVDEEQELLKLAEDKIIDPKEVTRLIQEIRYSPNIDNQGLDLSKTNTALKFMLRTKRMSMLFTTKILSAEEALILHKLSSKLKSQYYGNA